MIADFYTKPLIGSLFKKMRDIVIGLAPFPVEECVGERTLTTGNLGQEEDNKVKRKMMYAGILKKVLRGKNGSNEDNELNNYSSKQLMGIYL